MSYGPCPHCGGTLGHTRECHLYKPVRIVPITPSGGVVTLLGRDPTGAVLAMQTALHALRTCRVSMDGTRFKEKQYDEHSVKEAITRLEQALGTKV